MAPPDRAARVAFVLCGAACLVPWQAYISSLAFFMALVPGRAVQYLIPVVNMCAILACSALVVACGDRCGAAGTRVLASGGGLMAALAIVPAQNWYLLRTGAMAVNGTLVGAGGEDGAGAAAEATIFYVVLGSTLCCAVGSSVMQSSLFGLAGAMSADGRLTVWLTVGQGIAGVGVVALRFATKAALGDAKAALSTLIFFGIGVGVVALSLVSFLVMRRSQSYAEYRRKALDTGSAAINDAHAAFVGDEHTPMEDAAGALLGTPVVSQTGVLRKVWRQAGTACLVFTTCISCFPGLTASLESTTFNLGSWFPLALVATYNLGDLVGKTLPQYVAVFRGGNRPRVALPLAALCHVAFVPLFILRDANSGLGDWYAFGVVAALGLTTGYLGCSAMMLGPEQCDSAAEREVAGTLDTLFLVTGLTLGSVVGLVISLVRT